MGAPPDDPRRDRLESWLAEQRRIQLEHAPLSWQQQLELRRWKAQRWVAQRLQRLADRAFERGMDTADTVSEAIHDHPDRISYIPSAWHVLPRALRFLQVDETDTFVEFGCGKGRVLLQAAKQPFRRVIGVEISPGLAEIARANLERRHRRRRCHDVEVIVADAADYEVPDDMTVAYLCRPFVDQTLDAVLQRIIESLDRRSRRLRLIYVCPTIEPRGRILATERFQVLREQRSRLLDTPLSHAVIYESV